MTLGPSRIAWRIRETAEALRFVVASQAAGLVGIALGFAAFRIGKIWVPAAAAVTLAFLALVAGYALTRLALYRAIGTAAPRRVLKALYRLPSGVAARCRTIISSSPTTPRSLSPSGRMTITRLST